MQYNTTELKIYIVLYTLIVNQNKIHCTIYTDLGQSRLCTADYALLTGYRGSLDTWTDVHMTAAKVWASYNINKYRNLRTQQMLVHSLLCIFVHHGL
jgi:hypothetical protein